MTQSISSNTQSLPIAAEVTKSGGSAPKTDRQLPIDSKPLLIVRIKECVHSLFQKLSRLFIPKTKTKDDLIKHVDQIYKTTKLNNRYINWEKTFIKRLNASKIHPKEKEIEEVLQESAGALTNERNDLTKEELEEYKKTLIKTYNAAIKVKNQIQPIINDLGNMVSNEEKKVTTIVKHKIKQLNDIRKKYPQLDLEKDIECIEENLNKEHNDIKTQLEKTLNNFKNWNTDLENVSMVLSDRYGELSEVENANQIYTTSESKLNNQYNTWKKILTNKNKLDASTITSKNIEEILQKSKEVLTSTEALDSTIDTLTKEEVKEYLDTLTKEELEKYKEILTNTLKAVTEPEEQKKKIIDDLFKIFTNVEQTLDKICNVNKHDLENILKNNPRLKTQINSLVKKLEEKRNEIQEKISDTFSSLMKETFNNVIEKQLYDLSIRKIDIEARLKDLDHVIKQK